MPQAPQLELLATESPEPEERPLPEQEGLAAEPPGPAALGPVGPFEPVEKQRLKVPEPERPAANLGLTVPEPVELLEPAEKQRSKALQPEVLESEDLI